LLNVAGYYDSLLAFLQQSEAAGFMASSQNELLQVDTDADALLDRLGTLAALATAPDDYRRT
ncbi:MAG: LOG family protein, partial [Rhizobiales bacterium]|nr:LOG family protein [Rhizobacter sp.]